MAQNIVWIYKGMVLFGTGSWMLMAACNNLLDAKTNVILLTRMMSMEEIRLDGKMGQGLLYRSIQSSLFVFPMLRTIAAMQLVIGLSLLVSSVLIMNIPFYFIEISESIVAIVVNLSILSLTLHWFVFLIGGLWFGYWIKMGQVQMVHFTMLILSILLHVMIVPSL